MNLFTEDGRLFALYIKLLNTAFTDLGVYKMIEARCYRPDGCIIT